MQARERILQVAQRLEDKYGQLRWQAHGEPLEILIKTILSQHTNDNNRDKAFAKLKEQFPQYEDLVQAATEQIAEAIAIGGLQHQKAKRIQKILQQIKEEQGSFNLSYLNSLSMEESFKELLRFDGVGKKTAAVVLLFSLKKPYFPVDTHIERISRRLKLIKKGEDPHDKLNSLIPDELKYQLHLHLIRHGREICKARKPKCTTCVINDLCPVFLDLDTVNKVPKAHFQ